MQTHDEKVSRIAKKLKERKSTEPLKLKKKAVSHVVPKTNNNKQSDEKLDVSDLNEIIYIDPDQRICVAEPGATFAKIVDATIKYGLVPIEVPEFRTITIGGAVAGGSIESMSYKYGGFHDSCLEYEVVTGNGEVLICTPDNENQLLFQMMHWSFGTLGILTLLKFILIPAKPMVKVTYEKYEDIEEYRNAIWTHYTKRDVDFMDGIIHSPVEYVLSTANFVDKAPYTHSYDWTRVYFQSTTTRKEDYLKISDYFFRYNRNFTEAMPKSLLCRLLFGRFITANSILKIVHTFNSVIPSSMIPITVDTFIPFSKFREFMEWYTKEVDHFPLWCVPYKVVHKYEWLSDEFLTNVSDELFIDLAIYSMRRNDPEHYYRIIELKLMELGGIKTLISTNLYSEDEFWKTWNKQNYTLVKHKTDPDNVFGGLYEKVCR